MLCVQRSAELTLTYKGEIAPIDLDRVTLENKLLPLLQEDGGH